MKTPAQIAYEAYCEHVGWKSAITGDELPHWEYLPARIKDAWGSSVLGVIGRFIQHCDTRESELLSKYCNYLKSFIPDETLYSDFYHWCNTHGYNEFSSGSDTLQYREYDGK